MKIYTFAKVVGIIGLVGLAACQTTKEAAMMPPSEPLAPAVMPAPFKVGDTANVRWLASGSESKMEIIKADETEYTYRGIGLSCEITRNREIDFYAPTKGERCSFGEITRRIYNVEGSLWPLKVGNSVSFDVEIVFEGRSTRHPASCNVTGEAQITLPYGEDDVYKVVCKDDIHRITSFYSPQKQAVVKYRFERPARNRVYSDYELVSVDRR